MSTPRVQIPSCLARIHPQVSAEIAVLFALIALFAWHGVIPAMRTVNSDFADHYLVAKLYRAGYALDHIYEWEWLQRQKDRAGIKEPLVGYSPNSPVCFVSMLPVSSLSPLGAKRAWVVLSLAMLVAVIVLLHRMTSLGMRRISILALLAFVPLSNNLILGQYYALLLLIMSVAALLWLRNRQILCGLVLALGAALKLYPIVFLLYFLRKKQWRAAAALMGGVIVLAAFTVVLVGPEVVRTFVIEVLPRAMRGEVLGPFALRWNTFTVLLRRLLVMQPEANPHPIANSPLLYGVLQPVVAAAFVTGTLLVLSHLKGSLAREKTDWAIFTVLLLVLSSMPSTYHSCLLILPAILAVDVLRATRPAIAVGLVLLYIAVCLPLRQPGEAAGWGNLMAMPRLWLMLTLLTLLGYATLCTKTLSAGRPVRRVTLAGLLLASVIATPLAISNVLGPSARAGEEVYTAAWLSTDPSPSAAGLLFTMMVPNGYVTARIGKDGVHILPVGLDTFHPTSATGLERAWAELSGGRSHIVQFRPDTGERDRFFSIEGEQPSVSPDGRWLAFLRDENGRQALFAVSLSLPNQFPRRVSPPGFDVLDASFYGSSLLFAARTSRESGIFQANVEAPLPVPQLLLRGHLRSPSVSADGRIAFARERNGTWHVWVHDIRSNVEHELTSGACNDYSPVWWSPQTIVYANDCGRGLGLGGLRSVLVP